MPLLNDPDVRARARQEIAKDRIERHSFSARTSKEILLSSSVSFSEARPFDMFLSHTIYDAEIILGVKATLEDLGYFTYVDWINDPKLDRSRVTPGTADILRQRMINSRSLLYIATANTDNSRWMPWECGYFDGLRSKVAVLPVVATSSDSFNGLEFLGLYPYCTKTRSYSGKELLYIHPNVYQCTTFDTWWKTRDSDIKWFDMRG